MEAAGGDRKSEAAASPHVEAMMPEEATQSSKTPIHTDLARSLSRTVTQGLADHVPVALAREEMSKHSVPKWDVCRFTETRG